MSQEAVERLLGRLLTDDVFRKQAKGSFKRTSREAGFDLNTVELDAISHNDIVSLDQVSRLLNRSIKRF